MSDDLAALRAEIASARGLDPSAVKFLTGRTLVELEASADALERLLTTNRPTESEQVDTIADLVARDRVGKTQRRRALAASLHAPPPQPRDDRRRFAAGFDGGARRSLPIAASPEQAHGQLVAELVATSRTFRGGSIP
jgi:hypothetical protein